MNFSHVESKSKKTNLNLGVGWGEGAGGGVDGWTDEQAQANLLLQLRSWGAQQCINVQVMQVMSLTSPIYDLFII